MTIDHEMLKVLIVLVVLALLLGYVFDNLDAWDDDE